MGQELSETTFRETFGALRFVLLLWVKVVIYFKKFPVVIHCYLMLCAEWSCTRSTRPPMMPRQRFELGMLGILGLVVGAPFPTIRGSMRNLTVIALPQTRSCINHRWARACTTFAKYIPDNRCSHLGSNRRCHQKSCNGQKHYICRMIHFEACRNHYFEGHGHTCILKSMLNFCSFRIIYFFFASATDIYAFERFLCFSCFVVFSTFITIFLTLVISLS